MRFKIKPTTRGTGSYRVLDTLHNQYAAYLPTKDEAKKHAKHLEAMYSGLIRGGKHPFFPSSPVAKLQVIQGGAA